MSPPVQTKVESIGVLNSLQIKKEPGRLRVAKNYILIFFYVLTLIITVSWILIK